MLYPSIRRIDYLPALLLLFAIGWSLDYLLQVNIFKILPGLLLLTIAPGYYFLSFINMPLTGWQWYGKNALYLLTSIAMVAAAQFITKLAIPFAPIWQTALVLSLSIGSYILTKIQRVPTGNLGHFVKGWQSFQTNRQRWINLAVLLSPLALYLLTVFINPTVDNADGWLSLLHQTIETRANPLLYSRALFIPFLGIFHYVTGLSIVVIFKAILTVSLYISFWMAYDYLNRSVKSHYIVGLTYFSVVAPSVILIEANIVRPQLLVMIYAIPILLLLIEGIKDRRYPLVLMAFCFSFVVVGFHELGIVLLLLAGITLLVATYIALFVSREITLTLKQLLLGLAITYPYTVILHLNTLIRPVIDRVVYANTYFQNLEWRWWFINSYKSIDGLEIGWPGVQALYYYLYNGLLYILAMLALAIVAFIFTRIGKQRQKRTWLMAIPLTYVAIYFIVAEILPRLGVFFLPNRAWPHLMLGLFVAFMLFVEYNSSLFENRKKLFTVLLGGAILPGMLATLYLTHNKVGTVFPQELAAARFIDRELPKNAAFISTQEPNADLIMFYAHRKIFETKMGKNPTVFPDITAMKTTALADVKDFEFDPPARLVPEQTKYTYYYSGDQVLSSSREVIAAPHLIDDEPLLEPTAPLYFIYSFQKLRGLNGQREYNQKLIDKGNQNLFATTQDSVVYKDDAVVIIKIR